MYAVSLCLLSSLLATASAQNYTERYRPQYHWTPAKNWMNDPNGLIYHNGQYHMYYQYNPTGDVWGNMSWGHATSYDLLHWKEQPVALSAFHTPAGPLGEFFFSGSAVYDEFHSSRLGGSPPLVAAYTSYYPNNVTLPNNQSVRGGTQCQSIAYSDDNGLTWTEYEGNPVIPLPPSPYEDQWKDFRDPFLFWYEKGGYWVMVVSLPQLHKVLIYHSTDLKQWEHVSEFGPANAVGGVWECPNLFPLPLGGNEHDLKWVLMVGINPGGPAFPGASGTQYIVGAFDGTNFEADPDSYYDPGSGKVNWVDYGPDYYASLTYNGLANYERVAITWMSDWAYGATIPTSPWRSAMTVPRELTLEKVEGRSRLIFTPHPNLQKLKTKPLLYTNHWQSAIGNISLPVSGTQLDVSLSFRAGKNAKRFTLGVRTNEKAAGTLIGYDFTTQRMFIDRRSTSDESSFSDDYQGIYYGPLQTQGGLLKLRVLLDWSSVEVFGGRGESTITAQIFPSESNTGLALFADGEVADVDLKVEELASVWA